jgi:hypothetical protein
LSALSIMCRTAILVIALASLAAGGADAAQGYAPAKVHRKTTAAAGVHATRYTALTHRRHYTALAHAHPQYQISTTRKPTPNEAGRTAGLAIRRQIAREQDARRNVALHNVPSRVKSRPNIQPSIHAKKETLEAAAMDVASASSFLLLPSAAADEPATAEKLQRPRASAPAATHAETAAPMETRNDGGITNEEMDSAERESLRKNSPQVSGNSPARGEGAGTGQVAPASRVPRASADPEEASLEVLRGAMPAPLRGSHESLERQNSRLDAEGLERIEDESDLADRIEHKLLVPIPASGALTVNADLLPAHRYCRPWTALFLANLARAHDAAFHRPLEVNSAVRTVEYQKRLMEINGNAAAAEGDIVSPHLTGATIDIAKDGLSRDEIAWMRRRLLALQMADKIDVEEEFKQACFHITVYKSYAPARTPHPASQANGGAAGSRRHKAADPSSAIAAQGL